MKKIIGFGLILGLFSTLSLADVDNIKSGEELENNIQISEELVDNIKSGEELFSKCSACHGKTGEKKALGRSKIIKNMTMKEYILAINGYKDGSYGGVMKGLMKGQVKDLTDIEIEKIGNHLKLKNDKKNI